MKTTCSLLSQYPNSQQQCLRKQTTAHLIPTRRIAGFSRCLTAVFKFWSKVFCPVVLQNSFSSATCLALHLELDSLWSEMKQYNVIAHCHILSIYFPLLELRSSTFSAELWRDGSPGVTSFVSCPTCLWTYLFS